MSRLKAVARGLLERVTSLVRRRRVEAELDEEIRFHLEREIERNIAAGMSAAEARRRARADFGGLDEVKEQHRNARGTRLLEDLARDAGYALRVVRRRPGYAAVAVLTIALAIGANTAIFSVVDAVLVRPLPYDDADRLVAVWQNERGRDEVSTESYPTFREWTEGARTIESWGAYTLELYNVTGGSEPVRSYALAVSSSLLPTLGVEPHLGRGFSPEADRPGGPKSTMLSYGLWRRTFGADSSIVGRTVDVDGEPFQVVGVLPEGFRFPPPFRIGDGAFTYSPEVWVPVGTLPERQVDGPVQRFFVVGRLAAGASVEAARDEMTALTAALASESGADAEAMRIGVVGLQELAVRHVRPVLVALSGAVGLVLLIACVNLASLFLARLTARDREMALRTALGAGRGRLVRQLLSESVVLALLGGALGAALAWVGIEALLAVAPDDVPRLDAVSLDARVLAFTATASVVTGLLFGALPALRAARTNLRRPMQVGSAAGAGKARSSGRTHGVLVAAQVALAVSLLVGAGLLIRSFGELTSVDPGFKTERRITADLLLPGGSYPGRQERVGYFERLRPRLDALSGVASASAVHHLPLGGYFSSMSVAAPGGTGSAEDPPVSAQNKIVLPRYFETMGIPRISGREFDTGDARDAPPVVIVNRALADRLWPNGDGVGRVVHTNGRDRTVVGVVGDVRHHGPAAEPGPAIYFPFRQWSTPAMTVVVRTTAEPEGLAPAVRREIRALDPTIPIARLQPYSALASQQLAGPRFSALLTGTFAALALALAAIGVYGVTAFTVARRTREFGVRMALGASGSAVRRGVLRHALAMVGLGTVAGLAAAVPLARLVRGLLFGVAPSDPATFAAAGLALALVGLLAAWLPARRATRVDPVEALHPQRFT